VRIAVLPQRPQRNSGCLSEEALPAAPSLLVVVVLLLLLVLVRRRPPTPPCALPRQGRNEHGSLPSKWEQGGRGKVHTRCCWLLQQLLLQLRFVSPLLSA